jgi:hypothetical protein
MGVVMGTGDTRRAGEVVWVMGVAGVEETGKAEVLVGAVEEVEAFGARGAGEAIEVGDTVEAGDIARAGKVVWVFGVAGVEETGKAEVLVGAVEEVEARRAGKVVRGGAAGARKSNIVKASAAAILAAIQPLSLPYLNVCGSSGLRPSLEIVFLQSRLGSARSNISVLSYSTIMLRSVTAPLMWS